MLGTLAAATGGCSFDETPPRVFNPATKQALFPFYSFRISTREHRMVCQSSMQIIESTGAFREQKETRRKGSSLYSRQKKTRATLRRHRLFFLALAFDVFVTNQIKPFRRRCKRSFEPAFCLRRSGREAMGASREREESRAEKKTMATTVWLANAAKKISSLRLSPPNGSQLISEARALQRHKHRTSPF